MKKFVLITGVLLIGVFSIHADDFVQIQPYFYARYEGVTSSSVFRNSPNYNNSNQVRVDLENFFGRRLAKCFYVSPQNSDAEDRAVEQESRDLLARSITGYPNISIGATYNCIYIREPGVDGYLIYIRYTSNNSWEFYTYYYSFY
jgi:hypothetical protein